jgi:hypothetical protein
MTLSFSRSAVALIALAAVVPVRAADPPKSAASDWLDVALEATAREHERNGPRPTVGSRMLGIVVTAMYDAWAAYDEKAVGTRIGGSLRRPVAERTLRNKEVAVGFATYRALLFVFPEDAGWLAARMRERKLDPDFTSTDPATPAGVGNAASAALIAYRRTDGANQFGDEVGSDDKPYSDWTHYKCTNTADKIVDPDCWQPIPFSDGKGGQVVIPYLTPHWYRVKPFALARSDQFRPGPPPKVGSAQLKQEVDEVIKYNASLTVEQKAIVEFMRDGPRSTGQSGHWLRFAQAVSRRDKYGLDEDVKLFFAVGNVAMDAFIAAWEAKRYYDSSRPWTLVRHLYAGKTVPGWAGPGKGVVDLPAEKWHPYSPATFITPPFPGYVSGHSTVSGACAKLMELFTGSDRFGDIEKAGGRGADRTWVLVPADADVAREDAGRRHDVRRGSPAADVQHDSGDGRAEPGVGRVPHPGGQRGRAGYGAKGRRV